MSGRAPGAAGLWPSLALSIPKFQVFPGCEAALWIWVLFFPQSEAALRIWFSCKATCIGEEGGMLSLSPGVTCFTNGQGLFMSPKYVRCCSWH